MENNTYLSSVSGERVAMDRPRPPMGVFRTLEGPPFVQFKNRMRAHLGVPVNLDPTRCITCTHPVTQTAAGNFEHLRTGMCETCWDILAHEPSLERDTHASQQCDRLREHPHAFEFVSQWIAVAKVKDDGRITTTEEHVRYMIRVGLGQQTLPDIWRPGMRP